MMRFESSFFLLGAVMFGIADIVILGIAWRIAKFAVLLMIVIVSIVKVSSSSLPWSMLLLLLLLLL